MKAIHGGKSKNDKIDAFMIATLRTSIAVDLKLIAHYDDLLKRLELFILRSARVHDPNALLRLCSVPGIGKILAHKLGRTVYLLLTRERAFEMNRFFAS